MSQIFIDPTRFGAAPPLLGLQCEVGTFTKVVNPTTLQNIPVGFQPKALIIWAEKNTVADSDSGGTSSGSWGVVDDSDNNRCMFQGYQDGVAAVQTKKSMSNTRAIVFFDDVGFGLDAEATVTLTPSGFSLTWNTQNAVATRIHFIAYGGSDITGVQCGDLNKISTAIPATQSVSTDADCRSIVEGNGVVFLAYAASSIFPSVSGGGTFGLGVGTKAAPSLTNAVLNYQDNFNSNPSIPAQIFDENQFIRNVRSTDNLLLDEGEFGGFTAGGFDIDLGPTTTTTGPRMLFLIIKGGEWQSGVETARTTVGTKTTNVDFEPCGLFTFSVKKTADGDTFEEISANIGAADNIISNASAGMTDASGVTPTNVGIMSSTTKIVRYNNPANQAVLSEADLDSFNGLNFTLDWTTVDANAYKYVWVAAGNTPAPPVGMLVETGTFSKVVSPTTLQSVAVGFEPKALVIWAYKNATSDADTGNEANGSWGLVDDADNNACIFWVDEDGVGSTGAFQGSSNTRSIKFFNSGGGSTDAEATITLTPSGFEITWNTQDAVASRIHFIAYGGDDITGTQVSDFAVAAGGVPFTQNIPTDADVQNITEGNGVVLVGHVTPTPINSTSANLGPCLGVATKTTAAGSIAFTERDGQATSVTRQALAQTKIISNINPPNGVVLLEADFGGFTAAGWDIDYTINLAVGTIVIFLIIKGAQWESGNETARTTTGTKATTTTFEPKGLYTFAVKRTADGSAQEDLNMNIGATHGLTNDSGGMTDEDGVGTTNIGVMSSNTKLVRYNNANTQAVLTEAELDSFNATNFTLDWTTVDGSAYKFLWLVCGNA